MSQFGGVVGHCTYVRMYVCMYVGMYVLLAMCVSRLCE